ncbi:hypothetical protein L1887_09141 [Cichorium endivia]|nr:hypothetical protein L1887_09141 [Cichorium endivia]
MNITHNDDDDDQVPRAQICRHQLPAPSQTEKVSHSSRSSLIGVNSLHSSAAISSTFRKILDKALFGNFPLHPNPLYINFPLSCVFILCGLIVSLPNSLSFVPLTPSGSL